MRRLLPFALLFGVAHAAPPPAEREAGSLELGGTMLSVVRVRQSDGGLKLKLVITPKGSKKPSTVVLYEGGGDDDGPSDKSFKSVAIEPFNLPLGLRGVRVNFEFAVPGSKKHRQTDAFIASIEDGPKLLLQAIVRREIDRTKVCHDIEETSITLDPNGKLFVKPVSTLDSDLNDDDLPIDKTCHGKQAGQQITYKYDGETFVQIDPPPAPTPKKKAPGDDEEGDD